MAATAHEKQVRKYTGAPYIEHPMRVAGRLSGFPDVTEDAVAAAWLHDVKEDQLLFWENNHSLLPPSVVQLVIWLTNTPKTGNYSVLNRSQRKSIDNCRLSTAPYWVKVIKYLDRIDNLLEMHGAERGFKFLYFKESIDLFDALSSKAENIRLHELDHAARALVRTMKEDLEKEENGSRIDRTSGAQPLPNPGESGQA